MHTFHSTILREYDIRGIVGQTLFPQDAFAIGQAFATLVKQQTGGDRICVGRDGRLSSPVLEQAVVDGIKAAGCVAIRIGTGPTPALYYAQKVQQSDGAIQITGSHNPPDHNGFKMMLAGKPFYGQAIRRLGEIAALGALENGEGREEAINIHPAYIDAVLQGYSTAKRPLTVVWDPGNGAAGEMVQAVIAQLPGRHVVINAEIDGTFPNHHPDPTDPHTLVQLRECVLAEKADLGLAFDGDGDRLGVIDGQGNILWGDQYMVLLARDVLESHPGAPIIADVKASQMLFDQIQAMGGQPVMGKTGHSLIKTLMAEIKAPLAGEMSGHIFFADRYYGFDDALYAATRLLSVVSALPVSLAEWFADLPRLVNTPEVRFDCPDEQKVSVIEAVRTRLKAEGATMSEVDGVRVSRPQGWWLLRASNTQAVLVARAEADHQDNLDHLMDELKIYLAAAGITCPDLQAEGHG